MYNNSLYSNPYSSNYNKSNTNDMANMFPAIFNLVNNTKNMTTMNQEPVPTPIEEIQVLLTNLPVEQRQAIESSEEYIVLKTEIFQEFILWTIAATELGRTYLFGPGSHKAKKLLELTKDLSSTVGAKATNRIHELEQQLLEQQELFRKQAELMQKQNEEFMAFKAQFETPSN